MGLVEENATAREVTYVVGPSHEVLERQGVYLCSEGKPLHFELVGFTKSVRETALGFKEVEVVILTPLDLDSARLQTTGGVALRSPAFVNQLARKD